jgi:hypothetical protein
MVDAWRVLVYAWRVGWWFVASCHWPAASVPPNGFGYEGALGKAPSISPGASRVWFTRGGCLRVAV